MCHPLLFPVQGGKAGAGDGEKARKGRGGG